MKFIEVLTSYGVLVSIRLWIVMRTGLWMVSCGQSLVAPIRPLLNSRVTQRKVRLGSYNEWVWCTNQPFGIEGNCEPTHFTCHLSEQCGECDGWRQWADANKLRCSSFPIYYIAPAYSKSATQPGRQAGRHRSFLSFHPEQYCPFIISNSLTKTNCIARGVDTLADQTHWRASLVDSYTLYIRFVFMWAYGARERVIPDANPKSHRHAGFVFESLISHIFFAFILRHKAPA